MVRVVVAEESILPYLKGLQCGENYEIGLIIGQNTGQRDYVIHLARTPLAAPITSKESSENKPINRYAIIKALRDIDEAGIAEHAKHVTRMLPGGMFVLGIFVVGPGDIFADSSSVSKLRSVLLRIKKVLLSNKFLHGDSPCAEKLVLHLCSTTQRYVCKMLNPDNNIGTPLPVDWKFQSHPTKWHQLDCQYELDHIFPVITDKIAQPLRKNLQEILAAMDEQVQTAVCVLDGEMRDSSETIESMGKKRKGKNSKTAIEEAKVVNASLYIPCDIHVGKEQDLQIIDCCSEMKFLGVLASRVFLHQKATVEEAVQALKGDVIRSLASRLEMHWDSLIEEEHGSPEEHVTLHEPPRRVLVPLPHCRVTLSDYLFPGEGASEALISLEELLDLQVKESDVQKELELQADPMEYCTSEIQVEGETSEDLLPVAMNSSTFLIIGLSVGLAILAISIAVQFSGWTNR
ncbi:Protein odr-4 homolog [Gryllus bimaculatus]|nr:Protein odr-4 homolog [Gryllus bimaculatus]